MNGMLAKRELTEKAQAKFLRVAQALKPMSSPKGIGLSLVSLRLARSLG